MPASETKPYPVPTTTAPTARSAMIHMGKNAPSATTIAASTREEAGVEQRAADPDEGPVFARGSGRPSRWSRRRRGWG